MKNLTPCCMVSMLRSVFIRWMCAYVIPIVLTGGMMNAGAEGRSAVDSTDYDNVSFSELISIYKQAYAEAGFKFKKQTTQAKGGTNITHLHFEFSIPEYPKKKKGVASLVIFSPYSATSDCAPCSVHWKFFGVGYHSNYDSSESAIAKRIMYSADLMATAQIRLRLGKSIRAVPPNEKLPSVE